MKIKSILLSTIALFLLSFLNANGQTYFTVNEYKIDLDKYPSYTEKQIQDAITSVKSSEFFDYRYLNSGCNFKSHYISLWLRKKFNIETFKVWNFSKSNIYYSGNNERLIVDDPYKLTESGKINWGFHVAVGVRVNKKVNNKETIETLIIDLPTNDKEAIYLADWLTSQNQPNSYYTFTEQKYCNFESIVAAIQNNQTKQLEKLVPSYNIFAGRFWDDKYAIESQQIARALATDIVVMKYYKEVVLNSAGQTTEQQRLELTKPIADYNNLKMPEQYQKQISEMTVKIQAHILSIKE